MIINPSGPKDGWSGDPAVLRQYANVESDYYKLLWVSWNIQNNQYQADNPSAGFAEFELNFVTIWALKNPSTVKTLLEVQARMGYSPDELFVVTAPANNGRGGNGDTWNILTQTPEIGAVQKMLTTWSNNFNRLGIKSIGVRFYNGGSQGIQEATITLFLNKPGGAMVPIGADLTSQASSLTLVKQEPGIFTFPAQEAFKDSTLVQALLGFSDPDPESETNKRKRLVIQPTYQLKTFQWGGNQDVIQVGTSGADRVLLVQNEVSVANAEELGHFLWQIWQQSEGGQYFRNVAFLEVSAKTSFLFTLAYDLKKTSPSESLTIFTSAKARNTIYGYDTDEDYPDEKVDLSVYRDLENALEIQAVIAILSNTRAYINLGQPTINSIEIGHRPTFKKPATSGGAPTDYQFTLLIRLGDSDAMEIDDFPPTNDGFTGPNLGQAAIVDPQFGGLTKSIERGNVKRPQMVAIYAGLEIPRFRLNTQDLKSEISDNTAAKKIENSIKTYGIASVVKPGSKAPDQSSIMRDLINGYAAALAKLGIPLSPLKDVPAAVKVVATSFYNFQLKFNFLLFYNKDKDLQKHSFIAVTHIPQTEGDGLLNNLEDMLYQYFAAYSGNKRIRNVALLQVSDNTAAMLAHVFTFLDLTQDQDLLLNNWAEDPGYPREKALRAVLGTSELLKIQELTLSYYKEPCIATALINDIYIRWTSASGQPPTRRPQILVQLNKPPSEHPELQMSPLEVAAFRNDVKGVNIHFAFSFGLNLATDITVVQDVAINTGSGIHPVPLDSSLKVSGDLLGDDAVMPVLPEVKTVQTYFFPSIAKNRAFSGEDPEPDYYRYKRIAINSPNKNGWGFDASLGLGTIVVLSDTTNMKNNDPAHMADAWTRVYRTFVELVAAVPQKPKIDIFLNNLSGR
ncbi:hypothetical protein AA313_de0200888 [Arthrobotrys entomopaga]|nr:hypothetical protein AA313_de0200888 [Arthrobotrys entomopaga]